MEGSSASSIGSGSEPGSGSGSGAGGGGPPPQPLPTDTQAGIWSIFLILSPVLISWAFLTQWYTYRAYRKIKLAGADPLRVEQARRHFFDCALALSAVIAFGFSLLLASIFYEACAGRNISVWQTGLGRTHFAFEFSEMFFILVSSFFLFMKWFELWAGYDRFKSNTGLFWISRIALWSARILLGFVTLFACAGIVPAFVYITIQGNGGPASPPAQIILDFLFWPSSAQMLLGGVGMMIAGIALNFVFVRMSARSSIADNEKTLGLFSSSLFTRTSLFSSIAVICAVTRAVVVFGFDARKDWVRYTRLMMELAFGFLNVAVHGGEKSIMEMIDYCRKPCRRQSNESDEMSEESKKNSEKEMSMNEDHDNESKEVENVDNNNESNQEVNV
eukprot:gb/GECH01008818.1/.p1 GENE.gb/GECH01008818.1/~~gb/GECH01008818.1/.p1  ORF type:complete len:389 (+),score=106.35 gb/GECH01008818.1/:1-1167(+)